MMNEASDRAKERLEILSNSNDGFEIASEDMRLRGPGDIFGIRQSGDVIFNIGDIYQDSELILWAKEDVAEMTPSKAVRKNLKTIFDILFSIVLLIIFYQRLFGVNTFILFSSLIGNGK
jgi:RecG-like helicase